MYPWVTQNLQMTISGTAALKSFQLQSTHWAGDSTHYVPVNNVTGAFIEIFVAPTITPGWTSGTFFLLGTGNIRWTGFWDAQLLGLSSLSLR